MQNSFKKYGKWGCNLQNIGTRIPGSMWKLKRLATCDRCLMQYFSLDLQLPFIMLALGTFFAELPAVINCSAVLQNCLMIRPNIFTCDPSLNLSSGPWRWRPCLLTPSTACYCLCQQAALWTAAVAQKAKGKCLSCALVLSHLLVTGTYPSAW